MFGIGLMQVVAKLLQNYGFCPHFSSDGDAKVKDLSSSRSWNIEKVSRIFGCLLR